MMHVYRSKDTIVKIPPLCILVLMYNIEYSHTTVGEARDLYVILYRRDLVKRRRVSSVVEYSSANPKVLGLIPGPVSYRGRGL